MWYCVHAVHFFEYQDGPQSDWLVWEHMYLIEAACPDEAKRKGESRALQDQTPEASRTTVDGKPARLRFTTIRKVVECQDLDPESGLPTDGTELSYSEYAVLTREDFVSLTSGKSATVVYLGE